jgi:phosphate/sulfate permease
MFGYSLIILPVIGFVFAAGAGVLIRARQAHEDECFRDKSRIAARAEVE